jgi:molecular chaperone DnaJ
MAKTDFYEILGVSKDTSDADIKKAYRKLAMQYHPDRNPDDAAAEHKFKEISEAYDVMKDAQKRAAYDRYGHAAFDGSMGQGRPGGGGGFDFGGSFSDIFEDLFGDARRGGRGPSGPQRGADLRYNYEVSLEEAFTGKKAEINVTTGVSCGTCSGSGAAPGSSPVTCATCQGMGKVRAQQGFFTVERACPACHGEGQTISDPCTDCHGNGQVQTEKTLSVSIPAGVEEGTRIRLSGEGEDGQHGGPAGDLYLFLSVYAHEIFERDGNDIYCTVPIPMTVATLGGPIEVPTVEGTKARITIPDGTQSGRHFRLRSKGMPKLQRSGRGDMFVQITVETPVKLTKEQKKLLREFADKDKGGNPETDGFNNRVAAMQDEATD